MQILEKTKSFCPHCKRILETNILEEQGSVFMEKRCPGHGNFKVKIAKHAWYYNGLTNYYNNLQKNSLIKKIKPLVHVCVYALKPGYNLPDGATNFYQGEEREISLDFIKNNLEQIKNKKIIIYLTSSYLRNDLPEMINLISKSGNLAELLTDGIRIAKDFEFLKRLKKAGLKSIVLKMNNFKYQDISEKYEKDKLSKIKTEAIKDIKKIRVPLRLIYEIEKDASKEEIGNLIDFVRKDEFINSLSIRAYLSCGNPFYFLSPSSNIFLIDELVETIADKSKGLFTLEDVYYFQKIVYALSTIKGNRECYFSN